MKFDARITRPGLAALTATLTLACAGTTQAVITSTLPGGWIASWDDSFAGLVSIISNGVVGNAQHIEKSAEFTANVPPSGIVPSIPITFAVDAAFVAANGIGAVSDYIVIDDEILTNSNGVTWTDFHFDLLNHGDVQFDPVQTAASGGPLGPGQIGWTIAPFTNAQFSSVGGFLTRLDIFGGPGIPDGGIWTPGSSAANGELWIQINNVHAGMSFVLKETPTIPAPGALALLGLAGLVGSTRRRRN